MVEGVKIKVRRVTVSEELLKLLSEGRVRYVGKRIKLGRWVLKKRVGVFIGSKGEVKN